MRKRKRPPIATSSVVITVIVDLNLPTRSDDFEVIETDGSMMDAPLIEVDQGVSPCEVVVYTDQKWRVDDPLETQKRANKIKALMDDVWEKD